MMSVSFQRQWIEWIKKTVLNLTNEGSDVVTQTERKHGMLWWYFFDYIATVDKNDLINSALNSMWNVNHEFGKEYVDSDRIANVYFTGVEVANEKIRS